MTFLGIFTLSGLIVRYNTIVHPFTLADNRHYMFYVFRYTIRRAAWIRYLLIVPYIISGWMIVSISAGCSRRAPGDSWRSAPFTSHPFWIARGGRTRQSQAPYSASASAEAETKSLKSVELLQADAVRHSTQPTSTSTALVFLVATSLSLVTAPLVEPRYFIIPWVMWRLQVPAWRPDAMPAGNGGQPALGKAVEHLGRGDARLILETAWFLAVNLATCYVFLAKPYVWRAEDGSILDDGRLQRFMW